MTNLRKLGLAGLLGGLLATLAAGTIPDETLQEQADACEDTCVIRVPSGETELLAPLEVCAGTVIIGEPDGSSVLRFPGGTTGVHLRSYGWCRDQGRNWHGRNSIRDLTIEGVATASSTPTAGIMAENKMELDRVRVSGGFTIGVHIHGDSAHNQSNVNGWRMTDVVIWDAEHAGFYAHGGDSSAGVWVSGSVHHNCQLASKWEPLQTTWPRCAGAVEGSFLGNTFVGVMASTNWEHLPGCRRDGPSCMRTQYSGFNFPGKNQRSICVGCYTESDQTPSPLSAWSISIGGLSSWEGSGLRVYGTRFSGIRTINNRDPDNIVELEFGNAANTPGTAMQVNSSGIRSAWPLRFRAYPDTQEWGWEVANLRGTAAITYTGNTGTDRPLGAVRLKSSLISEY